MMTILRSTSAWWLTSVALLIAASGTEAYADPYYNVTEAAGLSSSQFAALYPTTDPVRLTQAQMNELPGINGFQGLFPATPTFFPMHAQFANSEGTVIGFVPNGDSKAIPYGTTAVGYAQLLPNGQYGPFVELSPLTTSEAMINSHKQILLTGTGVTPKIIDLDKGTTPTSRRSCLPPPPLSMVSSSPMESPTMARSSLTFTPRLLATRTSCSLRPTFHCQCRHPNRPRSSRLGLAWPASRVRHLRKKRNPPSAA